jgi:hypothetical protein
MGFCRRRVRQVCRARINFKQSGIRNFLNIPRRKGGISVGLPLLRQVLQCRTVLHADGQITMNDEGSQTGRPPCPN